MKVAFGYVTDRGLNPRRTRNEDNLLVMEECGLYLVADGVGGRRGGEMASRMVVDVFRRVFNQPQFIDDLQAVLLSTIDLCNQKIYEAAQSNVDLEGMATTLAAIAVDGRRALVVHVGDSRVYRVDAQGMIRLTEDHSEVNEALRAGRITAELAANHPKRNVINRALGADSEVEPDLIGIELDEQTSLLLCTDGVTRHLDDEELEDLLRSGHHPQTLCQMIRERCYDRGAEDNLTAIIVDFGRRAYIEDARPVAATPPPAAPGVIELDLRPGAENWASEDSRASEPGRGAALTGRHLVDPVAQSPADDEAEAEDAFESEDEENLEDDSLVVDGEDLTDQDQDDDQDDDPRSSVGPYDKLDEAAETGAKPAESRVGGWLAGLRWSLLLVGLVVGIGFGWLAGPPLGEWFTSLFGARTIYDQRGIEHPPQDPEVNAAYARHLEAKTVEARQRLNQFLINNPNHPEGNLFLGIIEYDEGHFDLAINRIQLAVRLDPQLPNARVRLAMAYLSTGQLRTARDVLQELVAPNSPTGGAIMPGNPTASPAGSPPTGTDVKPVG